MACVKTEKVPCTNEMGETGFPVTDVSTVVHDWGVERSDVSNEHSYVNHSPSWEHPV